LREGRPTLASRGGTFRSLRRGDPSKSSPRQQRVRITASFCLPAVAVRPSHPVPAASFRKRSQGKGLPLALPRPGRLQAGVEGRGAKPGLCKQRSGSGAGSRLLAEAGRAESRRLPPRGSSRSWRRSMGVTARGRPKPVPTRGRPKPVPRWRWPKTTPGGDRDAVRGSRSCEGHRGRVAGSAEAGLVPAAVERVASHRPTSQAKATRGAPEGMPEPKDRLPGPR